MERPALSRPRGLRDYDPDGDVDLAGFAGSLGAFAATVVAGTIALRLGPRQLPERFAMADVLLGGIATHKASRLLAKGAVGRSRICRRAGCRAATYPSPDSGLRCHRVLRRVAARLRTVAC
jgi:hypothetical protein